MWRGLTCQPFHLFFFLFLIIYVHLDTSLCSLNKTEEEEENGSKADLSHPPLSKESFFGLSFYSESQISKDFHGLHPSLQAQVSPFPSTIEKDVTFFSLVPI